jgi:hypothetical protein
LCLKDFGIQWSSGDKAFHISLLELGLYAANISMTAISDAG